MVTGATVSERMMMKLGIRSVPLALCMMTIGYHATGATGNVYQPAEVWRVGADGSRCVGMRRFQNADKKLVLMMSQRLESDEVSVGYIDERDRHDLYSAGKAAILIGEMKPVETRAVHVPSRLLAGVEIQAEVPSDLKRTMFSAPTFGLSEGGRAALFGAVDFGAVQSVLSACRRSRLASLGVDPDDIGQFVTPPKAIDGQEATILQSDYPADARKERKAGIVSILYSMEASGTIGRCLVTRSSGVPSLDAATCASLVKRARFHPALDANGKPVRVWSSRSVYWTPPRD